MVGIGLKNTQSQPPGRDKMTTARGQTAFYHSIW